MASINRLENMENQIKTIIKAFFPEEKIDGISLLNGRLVVTLKGSEQDSVPPQLKEQLSALDGIKKVSIVFTAEKKPQGLNPQQDEKWVVPGVKKIIAVASGKGGVGKSTTAVNLALALSALGQKTALFDADIYGPSIPTMLGYEGVGALSYDGKTFEPFEYLGIKSMSIGTLIQKDVPLIWRGAKACGAIQQLLTDVNWGEIDIMVIDMPPGTGDIQITLSQKLNLDGSVIVSTPQDIALIDAVKGVNMFRRVHIPILGIVENMSYYICPNCGTRADIFGHAGAQAAAAELGVPFLGEIPLHIDIRTTSDQGTPIVYSAPQSPHSQAYKEIAAKVIAELK